MDRWKPVRNRINKGNKRTIWGNEEVRIKWEKARFSYRRHSAQPGFDS